MVNEVVMSIDTGYAYTKSDDGSIFESKISEGKNVMEDLETYEINMETANGRTNFIVGKTAKNYILDYDKTNCDFTKVLVHSSICRKMAYDSSGYSLFRVGK